MSKIAFKDQLNSLLKQLDPFIDKIDNNSKLLIELARYIIRIIDNTPNNYHINILNQFKQNYHIILNKYSSVLNYSFAIHNQDNITNDTLNALYEHIKTKLTELNNLYSTNSISIPKNVVLNDFNANIIHSNQPTNKNTTNNKLTSTECNFRPQKIANNNNLTGVQSTDDIKINYIAQKTPKNFIPEFYKSA
ncbi:MAG: hypothetical protein LBT38_06160 [Deltaproteobacteria bacterium]|jgi:hypothetical protein|nr:hypothetical protein [Deltaproteobacteria bacterium]